MSWYSDGERFDEFDDKYCELCNRKEISGEICRRCTESRMRRDESEEE